MNDADRTPDKVGSYYDQWTERYRESFGNTFQACRPALVADLHQYLLERSGIQDGEHVLDAGCGVCGPSAYFAAHKRVQIDAVTISEYQVSVARELLTEAGLDQVVSVTLGDFNRLDELFSPATFDRILFLESLSHANDVAQPLTGAFKVLKPGGTLYIKDFYEKRYESEAQNQIVQQVIERVDQAFVLRTPSLEETVRVLVETGFRQEILAPVNFYMDNSVWMNFNDKHQFNLYGGSAPCQWADWVELRFVKPMDPVTASSVILT